MSKFKRGDRVAIYGTNQTGELDINRKTGIISSDGVLDIHDGLYNVFVDGDKEAGYERTFHEKQLRRLKKQNWHIGYIPNNYLFMDEAAVRAACPVSCESYGYSKVKVLK